VEATDKIHDPVGEIDELDTLVRLDDEGFAMNRKAARRRRSHLLDGPLANGDGRTFAHAVSCPIARRGTQVHRLAPSWVSVRASFLVRTCNVTKKQILEQPPGRQDGRPSRLCYTRVVSALAGSNVAIRFRRFSSQEPRRSREVGEIPTRSRHCKRGALHTVSLFCSRQSLDIGSGKTVNARRSASQETWQSEARFLRRVRRRKEQFCITFAPAGVSTPGVSS